MKTFVFTLLLLFIVTTPTLGQPKFVSNKTNTSKSSALINPTVLVPFFKKYPDLKKHQPLVTDLYQKRNYKAIWFQENQINQLAPVLYAKLNTLDEEGISAKIPYKKDIDILFSSEIIAKSDSELLLTSIYIFYAQKVFQGLDTKKIKEIGWLLPRKEISYSNLLNSLLSDPGLLSYDAQQLFGQYYKLKSLLKKYRTIEQNGGWEPIPIDSLSLTFKPFDSAATIGKIRQRLTLMGDLKEDSKSNLYDNDLMEGLLNYKKRNGFKPNYLIEARHIQRMNIPIEEYIKTIKINMERCRWIEPELTKASEYLFINIPSFKLFFRRNGKTELESNVFVGEIMTQTAIFSSTVNHIVFSPYWNVPKSIVENELSQAMATDKNFLQNNNMEWFKGNLREKPGLQNPMGLVKFIFPNSNDIYLHDTPAKSLFDSEYRAYSHGCINISKAKELALLILKDDPNWPVERINQAMKGEKETVCILKRKIPIHIGYFTALVNETGTINFYNDVYERDSCLSEILFTEE